MEKKKKETRVIRDIGTIFTSFRIFDYARGRELRKTRLRDGILRLQVTYMPVNKDYTLLFPVYLSISMNLGIGLQKRVVRERLFIALT